MTTAGNDGRSAAIGQLRLLTIILIAALPAMYAAVALVLGGELFPAERPPVLMHVGFVGAIAVSCIPALWALRTVVPLDPDLPGDEAFTAAVGALRTVTILRFAVTEAPLIALIGVLFVLDYGLWPAVVALPVGLLVVAVSIYPSIGNVQALQDRLEANGARTGLVEAVRGASR